MSRGPAAGHARASPASPPRGAIRFVRQGRAAPSWRLGAACLVAAGVGCNDVAHATGARSPDGAAAPRSTVAASAGAPGGAPSSGATGPSAPAAALVARNVAAAEASAATLPPAPDYEQADLDLENDWVVAPPEPLADCSERLARAGITFRPASLPLQSAAVGRQERIECGAEQVVTYLAGPARIRYNAAPLVTCRLALALARFEQLAVELAAASLKQRVVAFSQAGTYSCRKMARFDFVSEHSYANAIDIREIVLDNGQRLSIDRDFGLLDGPPRTARAEFLRSLARRAFDERLFSTVLTPFWDRLHRDHFHLDLARYRVNGARSAVAGEASGAASGTGAR